MSIMSMAYSHILPPHTKQTVLQWLQEDIPSFDYAGVVVGDKPKEAVLLCKSPGILCGVPFVNIVFEELGCTVEWLFSEGDSITPITTIARISGPSNKLLQGERTALNILTRASGVATLAHELSLEAKRIGWKGEVAGTRKTTPGFRIVEKYALLVGGISTHRYDLSHMIMLKDNHIWAVGSVRNAVEAARKAGGFSIKIEVECRSIQEASEAADSGAEIVMLDNFEPPALEKASKTLKTSYPHLTIEASGGITKDTMAQYCIPSVDVVSLSKTTQGYSTVNFSIKLCDGEHDPHNPKVTLDNV
ncbi:nicotinate-nucleotide pyrophosphorylase [carboxylating]-like [Halichondria panicea]|uniref:nicotinate-nucleotide pyrophosphorylase [carboxylating]-like n=1 Tax=Halichondria panicea TaxID=6063 RepID=UPI00312BB375